MHPVPGPHGDRLLAAGRAVLERLPDPGIRAAFVFGSATWGDADESSDLDLMVLLDRPPDHREVRRIRLADLLGGPPDGYPRFADIDRISAARFSALTERGVWAQRLVHSVVLRDTAGFLEGIRARATSAHRDPVARAARLAQRRQAADAARAGAWAAARDGDPVLAALHARLAVQEAGLALVEACGGRASTTHFVDSLERSLEELGAAPLARRCWRDLALEARPGAEEAPPEAFGRWLHRRGVPAEPSAALAGYVALAEGLRARIADPAVGPRLSAEDRAWAEFTSSDETYEEIARKVDAFLWLGRTRTLQHYLDAMLLVPARMNRSKVYALRATGAARVLGAAEFHAALRADGDLFGAWCAGLRLDREGAAFDPWRAERTAGRLLRLAEAAVGRRDVGAD